MALNITLISRQLGILAVLIFKRLHIISRPCCVSHTYNTVIFDFFIWSDDITHCQWRSLLRHYGCSNMQYRLYT